MFDYKIPSEYKCKHEIWLIGNCSFYPFYVKMNLSRLHLTFHANEILVYSFLELNSFWWLYKMTCRTLLDYVSWKHNLIIISNNLFLLHDKQKFPISLFRYCVLNKWHLLCRGIWWCRKWSFFSKKGFGRCF